MNLENSVILITGAAMRVGKEVGLYFASKGAHIAFSYYEEDEPWQETQQEIEALGVKCFVMKVEIRNSNDIKAFVQKTKEALGRIDVLFNNASVWLRKPFLDISEAEWDLALDVNLKGPFLCSQAVAPIMQAQGQGVIINITDLSAFQVWNENAHHAASKAGLVALTKSMAFELAPAIRVNAIAPGTVLLPPNASEAKVEWAIENSLLKRVGTPLDVAKLAEFLIENEFATGAVYYIDGGRSLV
ncbi:MAG: SDR family oxidoreductase [Anaerolineaceae bacterium]|jgi:NAD(P)-dependent dehydrogenase (short-subunit alcohol dehydrogenase family)|nr:SDR family oxidoreductase [Anaerolineaceae bacterium]